MNKQPIVYGFALKKHKKYKNNLCCFVVIYSAGHSW